MHPVSSYFSFQVMQSSVKFGHQFVHTSVYASHLWLITGQFFHPCQFTEKAQWHKTHRVRTHMASLFNIKSVLKPYFLSKLTNSIFIILKRTFCQQYSILHSIVRIGNVAGDSKMCHTRRNYYFILIHILSALKTFPLTVTGFLMTLSYNALIHLQISN